MLHCEKISKRYGSKLVLNEFSVDTGESTAVALLGPNGAGKSTLADILIGLKASDSGTFKFKNENISPAIQFQNVPVFSNLSLYDNVVLFCHIHSITFQPEDINKQIEKWKLSDVRNTFAKNLSGGQSQSLAIMLATIGTPNFIILDEPMNNLDPSARARLREHITRLQNSGVHILMISHDLAEATNIANFFIFMRSGRCLFAGTRADIQKKYMTDSIDLAYTRIMD